MDKTSNCRQFIILTIILKLQYIEVIIIEINSIILIIKENKVFINEEY